MAKTDCLKVVTVLLAAIWCAGPALAHRDRLIRMSPTGELSGLPPEYQPASLKITHDASKKGASPRVVLSVGNWREELPPCLSRLFEASTDKPIKVTASWYHDSELSGLPPYLHIHLPQRTISSRQANKYGLIFNLEDGTAIQLMSFTKVDDTTTEVRDLPISIFCDETKRDQLATVPVGIMKTSKPSEPAD